MHIPVLLNEVIENLDTHPGKKYIDATANGGGHLTAIADKVGPSGKILGIELDPVLFRRLEARINNEKRENVLLANGSYVNLKKITEENGLDNISGILFDLGMSSWQLEESGRGFSFLKDEPLDMRYDTNSENIKTAEEIINEYPKEELIKILKDFGEETFAENISRAIIESREKERIKSTFQLVGIIKSAVPFWYRSRRIHPATKTFQALRIAVNGELDSVEQGLNQALDVLTAGGRLAVITFHSLEDRIVKNFFRDKSRKIKVSKYKKDQSEINRPVFKLITKKPIVASLAEIIRNPRARSAKLRVVEKL
jgi:16S rRNA (cytosine1402-N4)-methyltransferase